MPRLTSTIVFTLILTALVSGEDPALEQYCYVRPGDKPATECEFTITHDKDGWTISSRTGRMAVESRYNTNDRLISAKAALSDGTSAKTATVTVKEGKATVERPDAKPVEFDVPKGTVVTSVPDWTDVFLLCRRFDRTKKGKQEFPALWIHPVQPARRLTFSIEHLGVDAIQHASKRMELDRYLIRIRNNSAYAAWADRDGRMIRLIPFPAKKAIGFFLDGYEKSAATLMMPE